MLINFPRNFPKLLYHDDTYVSPRIIFHVLDAEMNMQTLR